MQLGSYHNQQDARPITDQLEEWHCPACQGFWLRSNGILGIRQTESEIWLVNQLGANMRSSKDDQIQANHVKMTEKDEQAPCPPLAQELNIRTKIWITR
jgi:hypothetical protein